MKQVYIIKDSYKDNSVRVNYFEKDAVRTYKISQFDEETLQMKEETIEEYYDNLLFCERLYWNINEIELEEQIENTRQYWEEKINT